MKKVVIVGGGITGLSCAYYLNKAAGSDVDITLVESSPTLGGKIKTLIDPAGRTVEGGPDSVITTKPFGLQLFKELGLEDSIINPLTTKSFILNRGSLRSIPPDFMSMVPKDMMGFLKSDLFSIKGKLRLLCEKWITPSRDPGDESLGAFVTRRCGAEISERFAEPLFAGIYASNADEISIRASFPHWKTMEEKYGSITAAALKQPAPPKPATGARKYSAFISLKGGMQQLVGALQQQLAGIRTELNTRIERITRQPNGGYKLTTNTGAQYTADAVVLATPAYTSASILSEVAPEASSRLTAIPYASTMIVSLVYARSDVAHLPNATGFVVSANEQYSFTGCSWTSNKWADRTGAEELLVRCFYGKAGNEHILQQEDAAIGQLAVREINNVLNLGDAKAKAVYIQRWPKAMPQYFVGHLDRLADLEQHLKACANIYLVGAAYRGIGIPDCIKQGKEAAESILKA